MPFSEAFNIEKKDGDSSLQFNEALLYENNAMVAGGKLNAQVENLRQGFQERLDKMQKRVKDNLGIRMNTDEFEFALHVMEEELENSVPDNFREAYKNAKTPEEAVKIITDGILTGVNQLVMHPTRTVTNEETGVERQIPIVGGRPRADYIAEEAAKMSTAWLDKDDKAVAQTMLQNINTKRNEAGEIVGSTINQEQIDRIWASYSNPNDSMAEATANGVTAMTDKGRRGRMRSAGVPGF